MLLIFFIFSSIAVRRFTVEDIVTILQQEPYEEDEEHLFFLIETLNFRMMMMMTQNICHRVKLELRVCLEIQLSCIN